LAPRCCCHDCGGHPNAPYSVETWPSTTEARTSGIAEDKSYHVCRTYYVVWRPVLRPRHMKRVTRQGLFAFKKMAAKVIFDNYLCPRRARASAAYPSRNAVSRGAKTHARPIGPMSRKACDPIVRPKNSGANPVRNPEASPSPSLEEQTAPTLEIPQWEQPAQAPSRLIESHRQRQQADRHRAAPTGCWRAEEFSRQSENAPQANSPASRRRAGRLRDNRRNGGDQGRPPDCSLSERCATAGGTGAPVAPRLELARCGCCRSSRN